MVFPSLRMKSFLNDFPQNQLSTEREQELLAQGDLETIVLHSMIPAIKYCERYRGCGFHPARRRQELISICYAALSKAIKNFKPCRQRFFSYACVYLRSEVFKAWRDNAPVKDAYKHETPIPEDKYPEPLEGDSVEPDLSSIHWKELWGKIEPIIRSKLTSKEITVLELHFKAGLNYRKIGERMGGLSRSRIQQIQKAAISKIRRALPEGLGI